MAIPFPDAVVTNKRIEWSGAGAQDRIVRPMANKDGDIVCLADYYAGGGSKQFFSMLISGATKLKKQETNIGVVYSTSRAGRMSSIAPFNIICYGVDNLNQKGLLLLDYKGALLNFIDSATMGTFNVQNAYGCWTENAVGEICIPGYVGVDPSITGIDPNAFAWQAPSTDVPGTFVTGNGAGTDHNGKIWRNRSLTTIGRYGPAPGPFEVSLGVPGNMAGDIIGAFNSIWAVPGRNQISAVCRRIDPVTPAISANIALGGTNYGSALCTDGNFIFVDGNGVILVIDPATNTIVQTFSPTVKDVATVQVHGMDYNAVLNQVVLVVGTTRTEGIDNITFIDLAPVSGQRARRGGGELWSLIPELKDYLG